jgi:hypothetical protein
MNVGKYGTPTRCNNNSFIDLQDQLNVFQASFCPSSHERKIEMFLQHMVWCPVDVVCMVKHKSSLIMNIEFHLSIWLNLFKCVAHVMRTEGEWSVVRNVVF